MKFFLVYMLKMIIKPIHIYSFLKITSCQQIRYLNTKPLEEIYISKKIFKDLNIKYTK